MLRKIVATGAMALVASTLALAASAEDIKIGFNGDLSASPSAQAGQAGVIGISNAIEDFNAAGGVNGRKVVLVQRDDHAQPPKSIQNMSDLIDFEKVVAVMGPTNTGSVMAWKHLPNTKKVPSMGCLATGTPVTQPMDGMDNYMFRSNMVDRAQVATVMAYVSKVAQGKKLGFIIESTGLGQNALKDLEAIQTMHGMKAELVETIGAQDTDATSQLNKMKSAGVEVIVVWAQGTGIGQSIRSMEKLDYFPTVLAAWGAADSSFVNLVGPKLAEVPIFVRTIPSAYTGKMAAFHERVKDKLPNPGSFSYAVTCYDAANLLLQGLKEASAVDGPSLKAALEDLKTPVEGLIKTYDHPFSATVREGLQASDLNYTRWKDGKLIDYSDDIIKSLKPEDFKQ